jgi:hypothetical protein
MEFDLLCIQCKHYNKEKNNCSAFHDIIPYEIYAGPNDHTEPLPNQENNIIFEPINEQEQ